SLALPDSTKPAGNIASDARVAPHRNIIGMTSNVWSSKDVRSEKDEEEKRNDSPPRQDRARTEAPHDAGRTARARAGRVVSRIRSGGRDPAAPQPPRRAKALRHNREPRPKARLEVRTIPLIGCIISQNQSGKIPTQKGNITEHFLRRPTLGSEEDCRRSCWRWG